MMINYDDFFEDFSFDDADVAESTYFMRLHEIARLTAALPRPAYGLGTPAFRI